MIMSSLRTHLNHQRFKPNHAITRKPKPSPRAKNPQNKPSAIFPKRRSSPWVTKRPLHKMHDVQRAAPSKSQILTRALLTPSPRYPWTPIGFLNKSTMGFLYIRNWITAWEGFGFSGCQYRFFFH